MRHPFFSTLPKKPLSRLCELAEAVPFRAGEIVCRRGHAAHSMFFIVLGELEVSFDAEKDDEDDEEESLVAKIRVQAPSWVGDQCLFMESSTRVCTLVAAIDSELLSLSRRCVLDLLLEFPGIRDNYLEMKECIEQGLLEYAGIVCAVCHKPGHNVTSCPQVDRRYEELSSRPSRNFSRNFSLSRGFSVHRTKALDFANGVLRKTGTQLRHAWISATT